MRKALRALISGLLVAWAHVGPARCDDKQIEIRANDVVLSVRVPAGLELKQPTLGSPLPDFLIYQLTSGDQLLAAMYLGNAPNIDVEVLAGHYQSTRIGGCLATSFTSRAGSQRAREVFVYLQPASGFPRVAHYSYRDLTEAQARQADSVIASLKPVRGTACLKS